MRRRWFPRPPTVSEYVTPSAQGADQGEIDPRAGWNPASRMGPAFLQARRYWTLVRHLRLAFGGAKRLYEG